MTKLSILFVSLLLITASVQAQNYFGIKGGISFTSMSGGHLGIAYEDRGEIGGTTGLTAEFVINDYFSLAPELIFRKASIVVVPIPTLPSARTENKLLEPRSLTTKLVSPLSFPARINTPAP